jgi:hypothetical protein
MLVDLSILLQKAQLLYEQQEIFWQNILKMPCGLKMYY